MSENITERLLVLAGKKKYQSRYSKDVENAYDELLVHFVESGDYSKRDRAFRLMMRIKQALSAEGYKFREAVPDALSSSTPGGPLSKTTSAAKHLVCLGGLCALLKTRPPKGLDIEVTLKLMEHIGSKQCYQFGLKPAQPDAVRNTGVNLCLPKPITWAKLDHYGVDRQNVVTNDGRILLEEFRVDGISAYTMDRKTFYISNAGMCRRWVDGVDRMVDQILNNK